MKINQLNQKFELWTSKQYRVAYIFKSVRSQSVHHIQSKTERSKKNRGLCLFDMVNPGVNACRESINQCKWAFVIIDLVSNWNIPLTGFLGWVPSVYLCPWLITLHIQLLSKMSFLWTIRSSILNKTEMLQGDNNAQGIQMQFPFQRWQLQWQLLNLQF